MRMTFVVIFDVAINPHCKNIGARNFLILANENVDYVKNCWRRWIWHNHETRRHLEHRVSFATESISILPVVAHSKSIDFVT